MDQSTDPLTFLKFIVDRVNVGIIVVNRNMEVLLWNHFMEVNSGRPADEVLFTNIFETFPDIPQKWLEKKINSVVILKNFAFTTWQQRPYLFKFRHNRPVTADVDYMRQDCTFLPILDQNGEVEAVCITVLDVTDISIYQTMLKETMGKLEEMSIRDVLTGIYNRRHIEATLAAEFDRVKRYGGVLSVVLFDLDHFKHVNDTYGHLAGDEVLRTIGAVIEEVRRTSDIAGRYGGEEFTIVLPNTDIEGGYALAERLRTEVMKREIYFEDIHIPVTISLGVSEFTPEVPNHELLLQQADLALYFGKENGRNQATRYRPEFAEAEHAKHASQT
jgi:diguanylate cyclase (GGDEF)-like protein